MRKIAVVAALLLGMTGTALGQTTTMIIMDGSGSMWGQIDGRTKLEIARETAQQVLTGLPAEQNIGLMAYGHRERGNCADIELVVPPGPGTGGDIAASVASMRFQGKTPISESLRQAASVLRSEEEPATVVLVTDGIETCEADPCAVAAELEAGGVNFTAHVIGFGLSREQGAQLTCIADNTGGAYFDAGDGESLAEALTQSVTATIDQAPPPPADEPEPLEETNHYPGALLMPGVALATTGYAFGPEADNPAEVDFPADGTIAQCQAACDGDGLCGSWRYEPSGSNFVDYARCFVFNPQTEFDVTHYDVESGWASGMKEGVVGLLRPYVALDDTEVEAGLSVPEPVAPGAEFTVLWNGPANEGDWVDLVPVGHTDHSGELSYFYVNDTIERTDRPEGAGTLTAPADAGDYELRYILGRGVDRRTILTVPITIGGTGPATVGK